MLSAMANLDPSRLLDTRFLNLDGATPTLESLHTEEILPIVTEL